MTSGVRAAAVICAVVLFGACAGDNDADDGEVDFTPPEEELVPTTPSEGVATLDRASACAQFLETITDFTLSDAKSAATLQELANRTSEPQLAEAIRGVAAAFERSDPEIYSTEVDVLCE